MTNDRKRITLRIPEKLYKKLAKESRECGVTVNGFIVQVLREKLLIGEQQKVRRGKWKKTMQRN